MGSIAIAGSGGAGSIVIGTTTVTGGTDTCVLFQKGSVVGEDTNLEWNYSNFTLDINHPARVTSNGPTTANDAATITNSLFGTAGSALHLIHFGDTNQPGAAGLWLLAGNDSQNVIGNGAPVDVANWNSSTTYAQGNVVVGTDGIVYTSKVNSNLNNNPPTDGGVHWHNFGTVFSSNPSGLYVFEDKTSVSTDIELGQAGISLWVSPTSTIGGEIPYTLGMRLQQDPAQTLPNVLFNVKGITLNNTISNAVAIEKADIVINDTVLQYPSVIHNNTATGGAFEYFYNGSATTIGGLGQAGAWEGTSSTDLALGSDNSIRVYTNASTVGTLGFDTSIGLNLNHDYWIGWCTSSGSVFGTKSVGMGQGTPTSNVSIFNPSSLTTACGLQVVNTVDNPISATNYEFGVFDWTSTANTLTIGTKNGGSGTLRNVAFVGSGTYSFTVGGNSALLMTPDGTYNMLSFNGQTTFNNAIAFDGGHTGDNNLYVNVPTGGAWKFSVQGAYKFFLPATGQFIPSGNVFGFSSTSSADGTPDTGFSRIAPVSSVPTIAIGNGTAADASGTIQAKTKAGAPTASDVPAGTWVLIRDTTNSTTKLYYNNAGTLQVVALV